MQDSHNGQWHRNDWNQTNDRHRDDQYNNNNWQRRSLPSYSPNAEEFHKLGNLKRLVSTFQVLASIPRNWPDDQNNNQGDWTDANGQWNQGNQGNQDEHGSWTDANGQ